VKPHPAEGRGVAGGIVLSLPLHFVALVIVGAFGQWIATRWLSSLRYGGSPFVNSKPERVLRPNRALGPGARTKKKRFSVERMTTVLKQAEAGAPAGDLCRQVGIS
jgi:hypothetical protein